MLQSVCVCVCVLSFPSVTSKRYFKCLIECLYVEHMLKSLHSPFLWATPTINFGAINLILENLAACLKDLGRIQLTSETLNTSLKGFTGNTPHKRNSKNTCLKLFSLCFPFQWATSRRESFHCVKPSDHTHLECRPLYSFQCLFFISTFDVSQFSSFLVVTSILKCTNDLLRRSIGSNLVLL